MNLIEIMKRFPDQESCITHLEKLRWGDEDPYCPHCKSKHVVKRNETATGRIGRWNCHGCKSAFKVTQGTVFQGTKVSLQKWFLAITLMSNAKKSLSSHQLARDLSLNRKTAWFMMQKIRAEMSRKGGVLLRGIVEADESYIGGKPRKANKKEDKEPAKRGRGTKKSAVLGAVERGGKVVAELAGQQAPSSQRILKFIRSCVDIKNSELMTDEYKAYEAVGKEMKHSVIKHSEQFVDGKVHTNTIEGFWSLLKRAWYGQHHHYTTLYAPLYIAEACYKYNYRNEDSMFDKFVNDSMKYRYKNLEPLSTD